MTTTHATIICGHCNARLKVKPGLLKVMKVIKCTKCRSSIKLADAVQAEIKEPVVEQAAPIDPPAQAVDTSPSEAVEPSVNDQEEEDNLKIQLNAAQLEVAELDERVSSLQQLWQSKEVEVREMAERVRKSEEDAKRAIEVRDAFLAKIKQELAVYLVHEREAALARFSELETKLMSLEPED